MEKRIIDGENAVFGRLASFAAKELLKGNSVELINSEKVLISGDKKKFVEKMRAKLKMGRGASMKGPKYIRKEDRILKRMIRGMLPWDKPKGREAFKRLRCYIGNGNLDEKDLKNIIKIENNKPLKYFSVKEFVRELK
jgi:large subunit ribosomal protein L13